jgi:hypothetical protein
MIRLRLGVRLGLSFQVYALDDSTIRIREQPEPGSAHYQDGIPSHRRGRVPGPAVARSRTAGGRTAGSARSGSTGFASAGLPPSRRQVRPAWHASGPRAKLEEV